MSRRKAAIKRDNQPDPRYNHRLVQKMINMLMIDGKKSVSERVVYDAFEIMKEKTGTQDVLGVFHKALDNVRPHVELKSRRVGGATYQIPIEVRHDRSIALAIRWIRNAAQGRKGGSMSKSLSDELLNAYKGEGSAVKKKEDTHKMAEANRAFAHYRW